MVVRECEEKWSSRRRVWLRESQQSASYRICEGVNHTFIQATSSRDTPSPSRLRMFSIDCKLTPDGGCSHFSPDIDGQDAEHRRRPE